MAVKILLGLGVLALGLTAVVQWRAGAREAAAEAAYRPEGQYFDVGGLRMHAVIMGEGPDLVLIHGASGSHRDFTFALAPKLAERYRVIVVDRPGFGFSEPIWGGDGGTIIAQAQAIQQVARVVGADKPLVLGHSYGGAVALAWGTSDPESVAGLINVAGPAMRWSSDPSLFFRVTASRWGGALVVPLITAFVPDTTINANVAGAFVPQDPPEGYADHFGPMLSARRTTLVVNARQRVSLKPQVTAMRDLYPQLTMPVEIVHGEADRIVWAEIHVQPLVDLAPDAQATVLPRIGHMPQHVAMDDVIAAVDRAAARAGLR